MKLPTVLLALSLATACDREPSTAELANRSRELARTADLAVTAALEDPIMSDRELSVADDSRRVRTVRGPAEAIYPPRTQENAGLWSSIDALRPRKGCEAGFAYDKAWATRMPAAFALPPGATLIEAAGNLKPPCRSRVAVFKSAAGSQALIDRFAGRAARAGYTAQASTRGADRILGGARARDGASYYLVVSPRGSGSEAAIIATGG